MIYVTRNPRDTCVSFHNHWRVLEGYTGSFETFVDAFLNDVCGYYTPFIKHVVDYWNEAKNPGIHVLFIHYKELLEKY